MRFVVFAGGVLVLGAIVSTACTVVDPPQSSDGNTTGGASIGGNDSGGSGNRGGNTNRGGNGNRGGTEDPGGNDAGGSETGGSGGEPQGGGGSSTGGGAGTGGGEPCPDCPTDACLEDGTCVDCTADRHCDGATPRCNLDANECVECLSSDDNCADGSYCSEDFTCQPGCKSDASCASGECLSTHDCDRCVLDSECAGGRVCSTGQCMDPCSASEPASCTTELTCCTSHCVETDFDVRHCGGCGMACEASEFCGTSGCAGATIDNVCEIRSVVVVIDAQPGDRVPAQMLGAALAAQCAPPPTVVEVEQADATVINPVTGQPLGGGDLLALAGGPFGQATIRFLDTDGSTPIYPAQTAQGMYEYRRSSDDTPVVTFSPTTLSASHDYIVIQAARDELTGTLALMAYGFNEYGTAAAVWRFANVMLPDLANFTNSWYVFEWTDDGDAAPDAGDTFTPFP